MWGVRLLFGVSLLGLLLAGVWQGESHSHDNGNVAHVHGIDHDTPESDKQPDGSVPAPLHFHDAVATVAMLGPPVYGNELPNVSATWMSDHPTVSAPPISFNAPHRPPIV